jgi:hypothetical protein
LQLAYDSLVKLKEEILYERSEEAADPNEPSLEDIERQFDMTLALLESELEAQV